ncbi:MAG: proline--tRNA ligase [Spirochaetaceae bacterium]|jgi:prolyl-tRNA synthetase|nr:proline--tRNA ligase [Spirochaetaceae bacterium]
MFYTKLPGKTDRESPAVGNAFPGYRFLIQAGYVRSMGKGLNALLPLGKRVENRLKEIISEEMEEMGGMEISVPLVSPLELWEKTDRRHKTEAPFVQFKDRSGRDMVLSPTHEESVTFLFKDCIRSHKDLPLFVYQYQLKYRDELRPRGGLLRSKEFMMKDGYSFHRSYVELNNFFPTIFAAYQRIFQHCSVPTYAVEADSGFMQGSRSYEFIMSHPKGKNLSIRCNSCEYKASQNIAYAEKDAHVEDLLPIEEINVGAFTTLHALQQQLQVSMDKFCICTLYKCEKGLFITVHRADSEVSQYKLQKLIKSCKAGPPDSSDFDKLGQNSRCLSPFGLPEDVKIVVDDAVVDSCNLIITSGEPDFFYKNVNFGRDFDANIVGDIVKVQQGQSCSICGGTLYQDSGIELGHIFKLDDYYTRAMGLTYQNLRGEFIYPHMGSYGIGIGRLMEAIAEANHDERGLIWPYRLAPYKCYVMGTGKSPTIKEFVNNLSEKLKDIALVDDRVENIGTKFKDFELLGIPLRIVVGRNFLEKSMVEIYERKSGIIKEIKADKLMNYLQAWMQEQVKESRIAK